MSYDDHGRKIACVTTGSEGDIVRQESWTYLSGTNDTVATYTNDGDRTDYSYDYRLRRIATTRYPSVQAGAELTSTKTYSDKNLLVAQSDAYARRQLFYYDPETNFRVRTVQETVPGALTGLPDQAAIAALPRLAR